MKVILNCGRAGSAWSGGHFWSDPRVETILTQFVQKGGGVIGVGEPSALPRPGQCFKLAQARDAGMQVGGAAYFVHIAAICCRRPRQSQDRRRLIDCDYGEPQSAPVRGAR